MAKNDFSALFQAGRFEEALRICLAFLRTNPKNAPATADAAVCFLRLERYRNAVAYGRKALLIDPDNMVALDALAHACGALKMWPDVQRYGRRALDVRDRKFGVEPPPRPLARPSGGANRKLIAFSLFGGDSRYCETAVLNAVEQPRIYPGWRCRFYVDETVPQVVRARLARAGAELAGVDDRLRRWPGPMWRFAACDDPDAERVIFRDADSVISRREAGAVGEWIDSGRAFHMMRDGATHTELMLAGLWGARTGALPEMAGMVDDFLKRPLKSRHFADQHFLREFVWPYARRDLLQHDSIFGFMNPKLFPDGPRRPDFHTGACESWPSFTAPVDAANGTRVEWRLMHGDAPICAYPAIVQGRRIRAHLPLRYANALKAGRLRVVVDHVETPSDEQTAAAI